MSLLTREQQAFLDFRNATEHLRTIVDDGHGRGMRTFTDAMLQSISSFGTSELYRRQAERSRVLRSDDPRVEFAANSAARHNEKGLRTLSYAREHLGELRSDMAEFPQDIDLRIGMNRFREDLQDAFADLEIASSPDLEQINEVAARYFGVIETRGAAGLPDYFEQQLTELERLRNQPDRGATPRSIPPWKIIAIAIAIGIGGWAFLKCSWWRDCTELEIAAYATGIAIAVLVYRYC